MNIKEIRVSGYKSAAEITLRQLTPYSVFAGPNGSGKSNFVDALTFVGAVIESGANSAIRRFNGFSQIHCYKFRAERARRFEFFLAADIKGVNTEYSLKIHHMDTTPQLEESLKVDGTLMMKRDQGQPPSIRHTQGSEGFFDIPNYPDEMSALMLLADHPLYKYLINIRVFRFDPLGAKMPDESNADASELNSHGHNVATMLAALESKDDIRNQIIDWLELIVPGMASVSTDKQKLSGGTVLRFKEEGTKQFFPANLISDGTIYTLCIMTAVFSRAQKIGLTFIEEPERGLHPKAIAQLVDLMRENAATEHPVFITTHSESVVRASKIDELWLVNKVDGKTCIKPAAFGQIDLHGMNLDTAWLTNLFDGGLPW
jgi:predicted ATPase